jgi:hypothetical protein
VLVHATEAELVHRLFVPHERWGWEVVAPEPARPSPEENSPPVWTPPAPPDLAPLRRRRDAAVRQLWKPLLLALGSTATGLVYLHETGDRRGLLFLALAAAVIAVFGLPVAASSRRMRGTAKTAARERDLGRARHKELLAAWQARVDAHARSERSRVDRGVCFYPLPVAPTSTRADVFGGTGSGWDSLLATVGASVLTGGTGILLLDLSERDVGGGLMLLARSAGCPVRVDELPTALADLGLFDGLAATDVAELLADAVDTARPDGADPMARALDADILTAATTRIAAPLRLPRLAAALRILDNSDDGYGSGWLGADEIAALQHWMHSMGGRDRVADHVRYLRSSLEALAGPLAGPLGGPLAGPLAGSPAGPLGGPSAGYWPASTPAPSASGPSASGPSAPAGSASAPPERPWWPVHGIRILATSSRDGSPRRKDLTDRVLVQTVLHSLRRRVPESSDMLVIAGADHLGQTTLRALSRHAEIAGVRLMFLFERLGDGVDEVLGGHGGSTVIMRLGNPKEASAAAEFIGRGHRLTLSQLTEQIGRSLADGDSVSLGDQFGTSENDSRNRGRTYGAGNRSANRGWGTSTGTSRSRTWQGTRSLTETTSSTDGATYQRVYEFDVEPTVVQSLPATAFILVAGADGTQRVRFGDCNPGVVLLPQTAPFPRVPGAPPWAGPSQRPMGPGDQTAPSAPLPPPPHAPSRPALPPPPPTPYQRPPPPAQVLPPRPSDPPPWAYSPQPLPPAPPPPPPRPHELPPPRPPSQQSAHRPAGPEPTDPGGGTQAAGWTPRIEGPHVGRGPDRPAPPGDARWSDGHPPDER